MDLLWDCKILFMPEVDKQIKDGNLWPKILSKSKQTFSGVYTSIDLVISVGDGVALVIALPLPHPCLQPTGQGKS